MKSDTFKYIAVCLVIVLAVVALAWAIERADKRSKKYEETKCMAMFALANNLADSVKVAKINNFCLRYIR